MIIDANLKQRFVLGAGLSLIVLLSVTLIYDVRQWHSDWQLAHESLPTTVSITGNDTAAMIAALPDAHLLGQPTGNVPVTNLQLRVTGIVKINSDQNHVLSKAYISISGQPSKIYQVGDKLPSGVKIYDITPNAVILENDGRLEKLPLPREKLQFKVRHPEESVE